jgi:Cof subfamily protein (haloacid dehalogenase superfamily)
MSRIRMVIVDLDGTLIDGGLLLSAADLAALSRLTDSGIELGIATGRTLGSAMRMMDQIPDLRYIIPSNGGAVFDARCREFLYSDPGFSPETLAQLANLAGRYGLLMNCYTAAHWYVPVAEESVLAEADRSGTQPIVGLEWSQICDPVVMVMYSGTPAGLSAVREYLQLKLDDVTPLDSHYDDHLDISPLSASKGVACQKLMAHAGLTKDEVMAIGNGENDVPMFEVSGVGVALRDSSRELVKVATHLTVSLGEGATSVAIGGLVFGEPTAQRRLWRPLAHQ